ncbi:MAG TPA: hypothetical protein VK208_08800, partial [Pyrinomonadaceae bacterium]|nr:hypothetical protein [Pyrinomonadaceae bacterium]
REEASHACEGCATESKTSLSAKVSSAESSEGQSFFKGQVNQEGSGQKESRFEKNGQVRF